MTAGEPGRATRLSRQRILEALRNAPDGLTLREISGHVALHPNTIRFHLSRLQSDNLIRRALKDTPMGRPPNRYLAMPRPVSQSAHREYFALARALAGIIATRLGPNISIDAGREWARTLELPAIPGDPREDGPTVERSVNLVAAVLSRVGFDPRITGTIERPVLLQQHCPFLELAEEHRNVVCSVHLGLVRGVLEQAGAPLAAERLVPFATPDGCLLELHRCAEH